jgi:hypothetical protein
MTWNMVSQYGGGGYMGTIDRDTYRRVYVLAVIGSFSRGTFGKTRLQKTVYESEKENTQKPFTYIHRDYGQYSDELTDILEQLLSMNYVLAEPQVSDKENPCNKFSLASQIDRSAIKQLSRRVLGSEAYGVVEAAVREVGYLKERDLLCRMHDELEEAGIERYQTVIRGNLPDEVSVGLSDEECENLDLVLNPSFRSAMSKFAEMCSTVSFDTSKVKRVYHTGAQ